MDAIDIADSAFSLENITSPSKVLEEGLGDNSMYIYIGIGIIALLIGFLVYKYYQSKQSSYKEGLDCPGGFCTMNTQPQNYSQDQVVE